MICLFFILKAGESPSGGFTMWSQQIAHRHLLHISIGQTPVFQKDLTGKYLFAIILLELLIYLLDLGGLSLWIRKLLIMSRQAVKIH